MKQLKYILIILNFFNIPCYAVMAYGYLERSIILPTRVERSPWAFVSDEETYTSGVGGITFTYPVNLFTSPPCVQVSIMQNVGHADTQAYITEVSANSTSSTTVMVYVVNAGVVNEAPTGAITVCIFSLDNPAV